MASIIISAAVSRRGFVGAAGAAALSVAAGLSPESAASASEVASAASSAEPSPSETLSCDVVVAGSGISGLSAAVEAAQRGAKVILVEKLSAVGGNSNGAEGPFAVDSVMQKEAGIELPLYDALKNELEFSNYRCDSQVWIDFLKASGEDISWLMDNGVKFSDVRICNAGLPGWHYYDGGGSAAVSAMLASAEALGVKVMTETPMTAITQDETGVVTGIVVEHDGEAVAIEAKGVVLATGGTGANVETMSERTGFDCTSATINCNPGNTGDGISLSEALGAATRAACIMGDKCVHGYGMFDPVSFATTRQPVLWVNGLGKRFVDEGIVREDIPSAFNAVFIGQDECYSVLDQGTVDSFMAGGCPDAYSSYFPDQGDELPELQAQIDEAVASGVGNVFKGETVAELAGAMGVDPDSLVETVEEYNEVCAAGEDTDFFKKAEYLLPLSEGPFYAFKFDPLVVCAIGGLVTDTRNRVLDAEKRPIPGLYAVGLDGCVLYEETYNMSLSGSCNGYCVYSGRNAARSILESGD